MAIELPAIVAAYFQAEGQKDADAVARCFADGAVVRDDGHNHSGVDAIRSWMEDASAKYSFTAEPFAIAEEGDRTVVTSHVAGNFPGSPVDLRYSFRIGGEKIAELEIAI